MNRLFYCCLAIAFASAAHAAEDCHIGSYRLDNGTLVDIAPSDGDTLRWRQFDGTTGALHRTAGDDWRSTYGWTDRADGGTVSFPDCAGGRITFRGASGTKIAFDVRDAAFVSHGVRLVGRLVLPKG
ncbi:MAG TPA: hypothetical protein VKB71_18680, partial [Rhizomicrobium sp.]|nr:hypothetical protein [Rhizomicrobium sp.]